jgi:hypothetical protein
MKRQWIIKRQLQATADGQKRWDQAYQLLLRVQIPPSRGVEGSESPVPQTLAPQEKTDESCALRSCVHSTAGSNPEH